MLNKIFVGYTLAGKSDIDLAALMPVFKAPGNYKTEQAISSFVEAAEAKWKADADRLLYTGEFATVHILDPNANAGPGEAFFERGKWCTHPMFERQAKKAPDAPLPIALQVRQFLVTRHSSAWSDDIFAPRPNGPDAIFVGFKIKAFLKVLGIECALHGNALPLSLWYSNSDHRDILSAIVPEEFASKGVGLSTALTFLEDAGVFHDASADKPAVEVPENYSPCNDAKLDVMLSLLIGSRLGLIAERDTEAMLLERTVVKPKTKKKRSRPAAEPVGAAE